MVHRLAWISHEPWPCPALLAALKRWWRLQFGAHDRERWTDMACPTRIHQRVGYRKASARTVCRWGRYPLSVWR